MPRRALRPLAGTMSRSANMLVLQSALEVNENEAVAVPAEGTGWVWDRCRDQVLGAVAVTCN